MVKKHDTERKSDRTKASILHVASNQFAEFGYDGTTVRGIAKSAEIDPALIIRYFGSKDALFALAAKVELIDLDTMNVADGPIGEQAIRYFFRMWEGEAAITALPVLLRSAASNPLAADRMRTLFDDQVVSMLSLLSGERVTPTQAGLVASQMLGFAYCRYILCIPAIADMNEEQVVTALSETIERYLREV